MEESFKTFIKVMQCNHSMGKKVDAIHIGPGKSGSTWLWHCFREHPQIYVHEETDSTHYYSMYYHLKGKGWYDGLFKGAQQDQVCVEMCNDYLASPMAPERIYHDNPDAKIITVLRNPLDRAFSAYWHGKKKGEFNYRFEQVLESYSLYWHWLETSFYATYLEKYFRLFNSDNIIVLFYDDLKKDPKDFLRQIYDFLGVKEHFDENLLKNKVNQAGSKTNVGTKTISHMGRFMDRTPLRKVASKLERKGVGNFLRSKVSDKSEYERGMDSALRKKLLQIIEPEIMRLETLLNLNLQSWKK